MAVRWRWILLLVGLATLLGGRDAAQGRAEKLRREFESRRTRALIECGQRHLEYGVDLRDKGLTTQAAAQIVLAVESSEGLNPGANTVLGLMRRLDEAFWKKRRARPTSARLEAYEKAAARLRLEDQRARLELALWAEKRGLESEALDELQKLLDTLDELPAFEPGEADAGSGALVLEAGKVPASLVARLQDRLVHINGQPRLRDEFLARVPQVDGLFEAASDELVVLAGSLEEAQGLHALGRALLPALEADLDARPERRLQLVVFSSRDPYEGYLDAIGWGAHKAADGFADPRTQTAALCTVGLPPDRVQGLVLHELTHLYLYGVTRAVLPSWYCEGHAESFGGEGAFAWDGTTLVVGQPLSAERLAEVCAAPFPLRELLSADGLALLGSDPAAARRFYAQSWALQHYLAREAPPERRARFERWRAMCLGAALGADLSNPYGMDRSASQKLFEELFADDLVDLERELLAWLDAR